MGIDHRIRIVDPLYQVASKLTGAEMQVVKDVLFYGRLFLFSRSFRNLIVTDDTLTLIACSVLLLAGAVIAFPLSFVMKSNVVIGMLLVPFVMKCQSIKGLNFCYLLGAIFCGIMAFYYNVRIGYFFLISFFLLTVIELTVGKINHLIAFLVLFMSPVFDQVAVVVGFPLRLMLSSVAGDLLASAGMDVRVEGNLMILNGAELSVDDACMGLNMLVFSMLAGVVVVAHRTRSLNRTPEFIRTCLFFLIAFILNIVCNLIRIMVLVIFQVEEMDPMHEIIGLFCFVLYLVVPLYYLSRYVVKKYEITRSGNLKLNGIHFRILISLSALILVVGIRINVQRSHPSNILPVACSVPGFKQEGMKDGITKLFNQQALVYVKPIPEFFTSEHTPLLCWRGTGYRFESIRVIQVNGKRVYAGKLVRPHSTLYTAWWYANGETQTIEQLEWRLKMLKGDPGFSLINVTVEDEEKLTENIRMVLNGKCLNQRPGPLTDVK